MKMHTVGITIIIHFDDLLKKSYMSCKVFKNNISMLINERIKEVNWGNHVQ
jgi:hypothetical protein